MTPDDVTTVTVQAAAVRDDPGLAEAFYRRLFAAHPEVRGMFPSAMAQQRRRFAVEFDTLVDLVRDLPDLEHRATELGLRHTTYGVEPDHFPLVRDALLGALGDVLGSQFDPAAAVSWSRAYGLIAELMMSGAQEGQAGPRAELPAPSDS